MPTSGDLKSGDSLFFTTSPWNFNRPPPPCPWQIDSAPNVKGDDLGHYMNSYIKYINQNSQSWFWCQKQPLSGTKYMQKYPRNPTANKKNLSFELKMG